MIAAPRETIVSLTTQAEALKLEWVNLLERAVKHVESAARLEADYRAEFMGVDRRESRHNAPTIQADYFQDRAEWHDPDAITHIARAEAMYLEAQNRLERMIAAREQAATLRTREAIKNAAIQDAAQNPISSAFTGFLRRLSTSWAGSGGQP